MKSTKIKERILPLEYDLDTSFTIILIKKNKSENLGLKKVGKSIVFILLDKFFNYFNCIEEDIVWWSFRRNDFIDKSKEKKEIWTKKKYTLFIGIMIRSEI